MPFLLYLPWACFGDEWGLILAGIGLFMTVTLI